MAALSPSPAVHALDHLAPEGRMAYALRALSAPGCEQRLAPLAQHMAERRLVRAPSHAGTPLRHLDPDVPRTALSRLLSPDDDDGYLIVQLVVEGIDPALVARERGTSRPALVEQLRAAVEVLACEYEDVANAHLHENPAVSLRAALGGKRG